MDTSERARMRHKRAVLAASVIIALSFTIVLLFDSLSAVYNAERYLFSFLLILLTVSLTCLTNSGRYVCLACCIPHFPISDFATDAFFILCILVAVPVSHRVLPYISGKSVLRYVLISVMGTGIFASMAFMGFALNGGIVEGGPDHRIIKWLLLSTSYASIAFSCAWGMARLCTSNDPWFFSRVFRASSLQDPPPVSSTPTPETFFLSTVLRPSQSITRIREHVVPDIGSFSVKSDIEFEIPNGLRSVNDSTSQILYCPAVFQSKRELTRQLTASSERDYSLRRLNDSELVDLLCEGIDQVFQDCSWGAIDSKGLRTVVLHSLDDYGFNDDNAFYNRNARLIKNAGVTTVYGAAFLVELFEVLRYVKPICIKVELNGKDIASAHYLSLRVERVAPLVPVRQVLHGGILGSIRMKVKRMFTKKRLTFYFGLGNADCARSYHLSFEGPPDTFLADMRIERVGGANEFFLCEDATINSRYDQTITRLYIKRGRGFSRAALELTFEKRSQRALASLVMAASACFLASIYLMVDVEGNVDPLTPFTIVSIGTVVSIWQAMESNRAEEWLWVFITSTAVAALFILVVKVFGDSLKAIVPQVLPRFDSLLLLWVGGIECLFFILLVSSIILFEKLKLHGAVMDRVPGLRRALPVRQYTAQQKALESFIAAQEDCWENGDGEWDEAIRTRLGKGAHFPKTISSWQNLHSSVMMKLNREQVYLYDIYIYKSLLSPRWLDGWLMPVWSSSINLFHLPSDTYCKMAKKILE